MTDEQAFKATIKALQLRALEGDAVSVRALAAICLLIEGELP